MTKPLKPEQEQITHMFVDQNLSKHQIAAKLDMKPASVSRVLNQENVSYEVAKRREDLRIKMKITKEDVANILLDGVEMARVMAEPSTMIQGGRELGKMLGYYEPEVVKHEVNVQSADFQTQLKTLTDQELYALLEEHTVEGEFKEIQDGS
jgi:phage terminase small subunit